MTPETVLRAMLKAYSDALLSLWIERGYMAPPSFLQPLEAELRSIRYLLVMWITRGPPLTEDEWVRARAAHFWTRRAAMDYEQRMAGERPIDASPLDGPGAPTLTPARRGGEAGG